MRGRNLHVCVTVNLADDSPPKAVVCRPDGKSEPSFVKQMAKNYKISLTLKKDVNEEPVYQKQDGQRFSKSQTVKLNVNTDYVVKLVIRPCMKLQCLSIHGERTEFEDDRPTKAKECDEDASFYKAKFSTTNYDTHNRGKRKDIPFLFELLLLGMAATFNLSDLDDPTRTTEAPAKRPIKVIEFDEGRSMQSSIQSKLYKAGETEHSSWGQALTWIEYDCQVKDGQTYVEILKEKYV